MSQADFFLIRGLGRETAHWGSFIDRLASQPFCHQVVGLDLPGAGRFHKLTSPITIGENAEFLLAQIDNHVSDRKKIVLAVSLGAMVAAEMFSKKPDLFDFGFLMNTSFANMSPVHYRLQFKTLKNFYAILKCKDPVQREREVLKMISQNPQSWDQVSQHWAEIAEKRPMSLSNFVRQLLAAGTYRAPRETPQTPLVIINSLADQMVDPRCSEDIAKAWGLPLVSHPTAGHDICIDDPSWLLKTMAQHLEPQPGQTDQEAH